MEYNRLATEIKSKCYRAVVRLKSQLELKMNQVKNLNNIKSTSTTTTNATTTTTNTSSNSLSQQRIPILQKKDSSQQKQAQIQTKTHTQSSLLNYYHQNKDIFTANPIKIELKPSFEKIIDNSNNNNSNINNNNNNNNNNTNNNNSNINNINNNSNNNNSNNNNTNTSKPNTIFNDPLLDEIPTQLNSHLTIQTNSTNKTKINPTSSSTTLSFNSNANPYLTDLLKPISTSLSPTSSVFTFTNKPINGGFNDLLPTNMNINRNTKKNIESSSNGNSNEVKPIYGISNPLHTDLHTNHSLLSTMKLPSSNLSTTTTATTATSTTLQPPKKSINLNSNPPTDQSLITHSISKFNPTSDKGIHDFSSELNSLKFKNSTITSTLNNNSNSNSNNNSSDLKRIYQEYTKRLGQERYEKKMLMKKMEEYNEKIESYKDVLAKVNNNNNGNGNDKGNDTSIPDRTSKILSSNIPKFTSYYKNNISRKDYLKSDNPSLNFLYED